MMQMEDKRLQKAIVDWLSKDYAHSTITKYEYSILSLLKFIESKKHAQPWISDFTPHNIEEWVKSMKKEPSKRKYDDSTRNQTGCYSYYSNVFMFCRMYSYGRDKIFKENPCEYIKINRATAKAMPKDILSPQEVARLCDWLEKRCQENKNKRLLYKKYRIEEALINLFLASGLRSESMCKLRIKDFHYHRAESSLRVWKTKGGKNQRAYIDDKTALMIKNYIKEYRTFMTRPDDPLFIGQKTKKIINNKRMSDWVTNIVDSSNITGKTITPHCLRATYAVLLILKGTPIIAVQKALGHENIRTTMIYMQRAMEFINRDKLKLDLRNPSIDHNFLDDMQASCI